MKTLGIFFCGTLLAGSTAFGATFDCAKAGTATQKEVCADPELSGLDDELGRAFENALARATPAEAMEIRKDQQNWVARRDRCLSPHRRLCLVNSYKRRTAELDEFALPVEQRIWGREWPRLESEAEKMNVILRMVSSLGFTLPREDAVPYCTTLLGALTKRSRLVVLEPTVRASSEDDPRLQKWRKCDQAEEEDVKDPKNPYLGPYMLGGGPFRYYRVELDGNAANGKEDILYHERGLGPNKTGFTGYSWVDIEGCSFKRSWHLVANTYAGLLPAGQYRTSVLATYKGEVLALELTATYPKPQRPTEYQYELRAYRFHDRENEPAACYWRHR